MELRKATMADAKILHRWRNDPLTREQSVNAEEVWWPEHLAWLKASLANKSRRLMIAEQDGQPVGTVRIDYGQETELSWTVAPEYRGNGLGKAMVQAALPQGPVIARIKADNIASQKIAAQAGFVMTSNGALQKWAKG